MPTITEEYAALNRLLHQTNPNYGTSGQKWAGTVRAIAELAGTRDILDYGCGKQTLQAFLPDYQLKHFDPAIPGLDSLPAPADVVVCTDVLEHVEPALLGNVLAELCRVTVKLGFFTVATRPAVKILADGRNAHLIQQPIAWWLAMLSERFNVIEVQDMDGAEFAVLVEPSRLAGCIGPRPAGWLLEAMTSRRG